MIWLFFFLPVGEWTNALYVLVESSNTHSWFSWQPSSGVWLQQSDHQLWSITHICAKINQSQEIEVQHDGGDCSAGHSVYSSGESSFTLFYHGSNLVFCLAEFYLWVVCVSLKYREEFRGIWLSANGGTEVSLELRLRRWWGSWRWQQWGWGSLSFLSPIRLGIWVRNGSGSTYEYFT